MIISLRSQQEPTVGYFIIVCEPHQNHGNCTSICWSLGFVPIKWLYRPASTPGQRS